MYAVSMTDSEEDFPPRVLKAVETIVNTVPTSCRSRGQKDNLARLKAYITSMVRGPRRGRHGRPRTKMEDLIERHMNKIAPKGKHVKIARIKVAIGSYRPREEFDKAVDDMILEGLITRTGDHIYMGG